MSRRDYSGRRRRRPGRRPPYRYRARHPPPRFGTRPQGYSAPGLRSPYDLVLLRGSARRMFFNALSKLTLVPVGLTAGTIGYGVAGPLGALVGLGVGLSVGGRYVERNRFFRP